MHALTHFISNFEIIVASNEAIVPCIMASLKVIAHASRILTKPEENYCQIPIEKERLSIIFAVKKFHRMIFGRHFVLHHKPVLSIFRSKSGVPVYSNNFGYADVLLHLICCA